jgi:hypothetical protein
MYEFVAMYYASGILVMHIINKCSIISKYIIKNKTKNAQWKWSQKKNSPCQRRKLEIATSSFSHTCRKTMVQPIHGGGEKKKLK